jgi:bifunctional UDP-N-acetylglucosamine pyrophosphorylase/glucosamine-1-phosphate N-acetyltransferase
MSNQRISAVIMAAGKGTRLKSELPKVLHSVCGRPMLSYVFDACRAADVTRLIGVVGHKQDLVREAFASAEDVVWVEQNPQNGTGHAVMVCREALDGQADHALVLCGDGPLIRPETLHELIAKHIDEQNVITLATAVLDDPTGYGRIDRNPDGTLRGIVEHNDCSPEQLKICEVNPSMYLFKMPELLGYLDRLTNDNAKGEYYITDCLEMAISDGLRVAAITALEPEDILSINNRRQLAEVNRVMNDRILGRLMDAGVTIVDPGSTWIDARAQIAPDTTIHPFTAITGPARIGRESQIGPFARLHDEQLSDGSCVASNCGGGNA